MFGVKRGRCTVSVLLLVGFLDGNVVLFLFHLACFDPPSNPTPWYRPSFAQGLDSFARVPSSIWQSVAWVFIYPWAEEERSSKSSVGVRKFHVHYNMIINDQELAWMILDELFLKTLSNCSLRMVLKHCLSQSFHSRLILILSFITFYLNLDCNLYIYIYTIFIYIYIHIYIFELKLRMYTSSQPQRTLVQLPKWLMMSLTLILTWAVNMSKMPVSKCI